MYVYGYTPSFGHFEVPEYLEDKFTTPDISFVRPYSLKVHTTHEGNKDLQASPGDTHSDAQNFCHACETSARSACCYVQPENACCLRSVGWGGGIHLGQQFFEHHPFTLNPATGNHESGEAIAPRESRLLHAWQAA